jgi:hypothetical protein
VVPLLTEAAVSGVPVSIAAANAAAATWCAEVNAAVHSEICAVPDERLAVERELLAALPSLRPEIGAASVTRKVDRLSCVRYGSARYSVPTRLIGATVNIVIDHGALGVVEPGTAAIVAEHELVAPGETSILDEHYDDPRPAPSRAPRPKQQWSNSSALSARTRKRFWSAPRRSAIPAWVPSWRSCSRSARPRRAATDRGVASGGGVRAVPRRRCALHPGRRHRRAAAPPGRGRTGAGLAHRADPLTGRLQITTTRDGDAS